MSLPQAQVLRRDRPIGRRQILLKLSAVVVAALRTLQQTNAAVAAAAHILISRILRRLQLRFFIRLAGVGPAQPQIRRWERVGQTLGAGLMVLILFPPWQPKEPTPRPGWEATALPEVMAELPPAVLGRSKILAAKAVRRLTLAVTGDQVVVGPAGHRAQVVPVALARRGYVRADRAAAVLAAAVAALWDRPVQAPQRQPVP
jgi:hypothetical protein